MEALSSLAIDSVSKCLGGVFMSLELRATCRAMRLRIGAPPRCEERQMALRALDDGMVYLCTRLYREKDWLSCEDILPFRADKRSLEYSLMHHNVFKCSGKHGVVLENDASVCVAVLKTLLVRGDMELYKKYYDEKTWLTAEHIALVTLDESVSLDSTRAVIENMDKSWYWKTISILSVELGDSFAKVKAKAFLYALYGLVYPDRFAYGFAAHEAAEHMQDAIRIYNFGPDWDRVMNTKNQTLIDLAALVNNIK